MAHISEDEILKIIQSLPIKSTGPASIPLKLLKLVANIIVTPLCHLINVSFSTGVFPNNWKVAKVVALHKGGPSDNVNNYRPISLLNVLYKIMAIILQKRISKEVDSFIHKMQNGFRRRRSTADAIAISTSS